MDASLLLILMVILLSMFVEEIFLHPYCLFELVDFPANCSCIISRIVYTKVQMCWLNVEVYDTQVWNIDS